MDFHFYPYGNAQESQNPDKTWTFTCQHGPSECKANLIEACAMKYHNATADYFPFVVCLENSSDPATNGQACATKSGWTDYADIASCATGSMGNGLMHDIAVATSSLVPPHQWTPWVVVNGQPLSSGQLNDPLVGIVCKAYKGSNPPPACSGHVSVSKQLCMKDN
jgi:interferon gamma-inducible protein 30